MVTGGSHTLGNACCRNTYVIAQQYNVYFKTVSPAVVISTGMSVLTIFLSLVWFGVR